MCTNSIPVILIFRESEGTFTRLDSGVTRKAEHWVPYAGDRSLISRESYTVYRSAQSFDIVVDCLRCDEVHEIYPFGSIEEGRTVPELPQELTFVVELGSERLGTMRAKYRGPGHYALDLRAFHLSEENYPLRLRCKVERS